LGTLNREEGNSLTGPSFDFPPSRRARKADPPLHLPLNRLTTSHRAGARPSFALGWAVVSEVSAHCKRFVRALGPLAPRKNSRPPGTFTPPLGYAVAARPPISCMRNDLNRRGTMFALWIHSGLHALIVPNAPWSLPTPISSCDRFAAARLRLQRYRHPRRSNASARPFHVPLFHMTL